MEHKKKSTLLDKERREKIRQGVLRKKECEAKALSTVEELISKEVEREQFRQAALYINEIYYQDLVDERNCIKVCGYSLCPKGLGNVSKQQYHISAAKNKVYDITERKKFCSETCFKSSNFYKDQLVSGPLWLRKYDEMSPTTFLDDVSVKTESLGAGHGEEIVLHSQDSCHRLDEQKEVPAKKTKISFQIGDLTDDINDLELSNCATERDNKSCHEIIDTCQSTANKTSGILKSSYQNIETKNDSQCATERDSKSCNEIIDTCQSTANKTSGILKSRYQNIETKNDSQCGQFNSTSNVTNKQNSGIHIYKNRNSLKKVKAISEKHDQDIPPLVKVEAALQEWYTIDTFRLIKGDDFVRQVLREKGCTVSSVVAAVGFSTDEQNLALSSKFQEKYIALCRKLDVLDLEESHWDRKELHNSSGSSQLETSGQIKKSEKRQPLPSYEDLREKAEIDILKIGSYLKGKTEYELEEKSKKKHNDKSVSDTMEHHPVPVLPLLDAYAQSALRRRIVHDHLDRVLPDMMQLLGLGPSDINETLRRLVKSFEFSATNITFKPQEWALVGIILLKMISLIKRNTAIILDTCSSQKYINLLLLEYGTDMKHLELKINEFHADIHYLIKKLKPSAVVN